MAGQAVNRTVVPVVERKGMEQQTCRNPGGGGVAVLTSQTEYPGVNGRFLMAVDTILGRTCKGLFKVAYITFDFGMTPLDGEKCIVVKILHPIGTIVTGQAIGTKLLQVGLHKFGCLLGMAVCTGLLI